MILSLVAEPVCRFRSRCPRGPLARIGLLRLLASFEATVLLCGLVTEATAWSSRSRAVPCGVLVPATSLSSALASSRTKRLASGLSNCLHRAGHRAQASRTLLRRSGPSTFVPLEKIGPSIFDYL